MAYEFSESDERVLRIVAAAQDKAHLAQMLVRLLEERLLRLVR